jgi:hypothetical protein
MANPNQTKEVSMPDIHALAHALFERSQIMAAQSNFISDAVLGPRPRLREE